MTDDINDNMDELDVSATSDDFEIEIEDDIPETERPRRPENAKADVPAEDDEELAGYSESVQKRIKKLRFEYHEAERQRQAAIREREEAVRFAQSQHSEVERLREQLRSGQKATVDQAKGRLKAELEQAKRDYKNAYESGDSDALLTAQEAMIRVSNDLSRLDSWAAQPTAQTSQQAQPAPQKPAQPQPQQPQAPQLNAQQQKWLGDNPWFGSDSEMTGAAYGLHEKLVRNGVDPNSQSYYSQIDEGMRKRFPEYFDDGSEEVAVPPKKRANVVAPATRSGKQSRDKIVLTSSQVAIAKRLGLTNQQYAAQLLKDARNG